jgi:hypothetical protein
VARKPIPILLSVVFLHRKRLRSQVVQAMAKYGLTPVTHSDAVPPGIEKFPVIQAARNLIPKVTGYVTAVDARSFQTHTPPWNIVRDEFVEAAKSRLPICVLVLDPPTSTSKNTRRALDALVGMLQVLYHQHRGQETLFTVIELPSTQIGRRLDAQLKRFRYLIDHTDGPDTEPQPPGLGPGSVFVATPEGFDLAPRPLPQAEREDATQQALHTRLVRRIARLQAQIDRIRNTHPTLAAEFDDYTAFVTADLDDLDVASLWSAGAGLDEFARALDAPVSGAMTEPLEPEVMAELRALVRDHTAFIMGFSEGRVLTTRAQALHDVDRKPSELAATVAGVLRSMLALPRLLAEHARHLVQSLNRALDDLPFQTLSVISGGYETGRNGLIAIVRAIHPLLILAGAADIARILAGDAQADTLRTALIYLRDNENTILALAASDRQMAEWLAWSIARARQFTTEFSDSL